MITIHVHTTQLRPFDIVIGMLKTLLSYTHLKKTMQYSHFSLKKTEKISCEYIQIKTIEFRKV